MKLHKKLAVLLAAALLALLCAACGATKEVAADPLNGAVIFDKDGVKVTTDGYEVDDAEGPVIWLNIENKGEADVYLGVTDSSVNGFMANAILIQYEKGEDGNEYSMSYDFGITVPAGSSVRRALSYYKLDYPGVNTDTLGELEFRFTTAPDMESVPDYTSEPVVLKTGEEVAPVDITTLGTTVLDDDKMLVVIGEQDYDDWFGPEVMMYVQNKSDKCIGAGVHTAEGDGVFCDYVYSYLTMTPGKSACCWVSFDGDLRELKGIEKLTLTMGRHEAESIAALGDDDFEPIEPAVTVTYPPQVWGEYENDGMTLTIRPRINELVTVETPTDDPDGILFTVSETESMKAGNHEGAGWLFSIGKISEDKFHELLCYDMSGIEVFAQDNNGDYYVSYRPTDVRFERATAEEMDAGMKQWSMLCDNISGLENSFHDENGLEYVGYNNTEIDMYLARAAWMADANATLSTTEFGPQTLAGVDGAKYAEFVMNGYFYDSEDEAPDGEYVVLNFPGDDVRIDFFFAPGGYARVVSGSSERMYQAAWCDDNISYAEAMQGWYYAACEAAGVKDADDSLNDYIGEWHEKVAGRGQVTVTQSVAPGKADVVVRWPQSANQENGWRLVASLDGDKLTYEMGIFEALEYDENGNTWDNDWNNEESGWFHLDSDGALCWHNDVTGQESEFVR